MSTLVVGSVAFDAVQTPLGKCKEELGGSATYFGVSASFFNKVNLVAVVGNDFPSKYVTLLKKRNIDTKGLEIKRGKTFRWRGKYSWDFSEVKTLSTCLNVFSHFNPHLPQEYKKSKYVFLANIDPEIQESILRQIKSPELIVADTMNYWIENKRKTLLKLLKKVDIFLLNEAEARQLTSETNLVKAAKTILSFGPKKIVIKKGEHGALFFAKGSIFCLPAFLLEVIRDPTGAGDTFAGGFVGYLAKCRKINQAHLKEALVYGSVMATFAVEDFGLRALLEVNKAKIAKRYREFKKLSCF